MAKILVFGAEGQLGRELAKCAELREIPMRLIGRDEGDVTNTGIVMRLMAGTAPGLVVNAAAYTRVDKAESEANEAFRVNALGPHILASACAKQGIPLLHLSTDYVFDGTKTGAYVETDPISPLGVYGHSKAKGESAVRAQLEHHLIMRTSWVYGAYGTNFLKTILRLIKERDELRVVADQHGCPTGTSDIADAILAIAPVLMAREPVWGTYHFAGQGVTTWHGFASEIVNAQVGMTHKRPPVIPISTSEYPTAARRPLNSELASAHFATVFGVKAKDWRDRAREVIATLLKDEQHKNHIY